MGEATTEAPEEDPWTTLDPVGVGSGERRGSGCDDRRSSAVSVISLFGAARASMPIAVREELALTTSRAVKDDNPLLSLAPHLLPHPSEATSLLPSGACSSRSKSHSGAVPSDDYTWPRAAWYILAVELCERLAYYGASIVFFTYMRSMLELEQSVSNALYNVFNFWAYGSCLIGGYIADTYLGRVSTIMLFSLFYVLGLVSLLLSALPQTWKDYPDNPDDGFAIYGFITAIVFLGLGTGGIKANVSPLLADQMEDLPTHVYASVFRWFYWSINIGAFVGILVTPLMYDQIGEKKLTNPDDPEKGLSGTGYWASYSLPLGLFLVGALVFLVGRLRGLYIDHAPGGSVLTRCYRAARFAYREKAIAKEEGAPPRAHWLDWADRSDLYAEPAKDLKISLQACTVFLWYPVYWLCYNQMFSNLVAQADLLDRPDWIAAEALNVLGSATLIILIPLFDTLIFPFLRRRGVDPPPMIRISIGFALASISILYCAGLEWYLHQKGRFEDGDYIPDEGERIVVWWQIPPYVIFAASEIFASVGGLEFAYTEAPESMKSLVMSLYLFTNAAGSLLGIAASPLMKPEQMVIVFFSFGGVMALTTIAFYITFRNHGKKKQYENTALCEAALPKEEEEERLPAV